MVCDLYPSHVLPWAWEEVEGETMSVNEVEATTVGICWQQGREEGGEDVECVWLCGGCVAPLIREIKCGRCCTVALMNVCAVIYMAMWMLCVYCGMDCGLPVGSRHLTENWCP